MSRIDPKNREEAFAHQFNDDATMLMHYALQGKQKEFKSCLDRIKIVIKCYESKRLLKQHIVAVKKAKVNQEFQTKFLNLK